LISLTVELSATAVDFHFGGGVHGFGGFVLARSTSVGRCPPLARFVDLAIALGELSFSI